MCCLHILLCVSCCYNKFTTKDDCGKVCETDLWPCQEFLLLFSFTKHNFRQGTFTPLPTFISGYEWWPLIISFFKYRKLCIQVILYFLWVLGNSLLDFPHLPGKNVSLAHPTSNVYCISHFTNLVLSSAIVIYFVVNYICSLNLTEHAQQWRLSNKLLDRMWGGAGDSKQPRENEIILYPPPVGIELHDWLYVDVVTIV